MTPGYFSQRASNSKAAEINWLIQLALEDPTIVSLAAGLVDEKTLPADLVATTINRLLNQPGGEKALQYGTTRGNLQLRQCCARLFTEQENAGDNPVHPDHIVITTGSQQFLYLVAEVLLNPGDIVICEAPGYFVYMEALKAFEVNILEVPVDQHGMQITALESLLLQLRQSQQIHRLKMIYTVDYFQNPSGCTLSLQRREELIRLVQQYPEAPVHILEDAAYRDLWFVEPPPGSLYELSGRSDRYLYCSSFSKTFSPGLKTGFGLANSEILEKILIAKGGQDFGSSHINQAVMSHVLHHGIYEEHCAKLRVSYQSKADHLNELLHGFCGDFLQWHSSSGGLYIWAQADLATGPDSDFFSTCMQEKVLYVPGEYCFANPILDPEQRCYMRLSYGLPSNDDMEIAVQRLSKVVKKIKKE